MAGVTTGERIQCGLLICDHEGPEMFISGFYCSACGVTYSGPWLVQRGHGAQEITPIMTLHCTDGVRWTCQRCRSANHTFAFYWLASQLEIGTDGRVYLG
jgi:hypothetical protein